MYFEAKIREIALTTVRILFSYGLKDAICYHNNGRYYDNDFWHWVKDHKSVLDSYNLYVTSGETKICIFDDYEDWVIKIGFQRNTCPDFVKYDNAIDFCRLEAEHYQKAVESNLEGYFAQTYSCGFVDGVEVFVQEKVSINEDSVSDNIYEYVSSQYPKTEYEDEEEREQHIASAVEYCDDEDIVIAMLGKDFDIDKLLVFLEENEINDLHSGNWGTTWDGRTVMIDFSGYR